MIPKVIHYCWFGNSPLQNLLRDVLRLGRSIVQNIK